MHLLRRDAHRSAPARSRKHRTVAPFLAILAGGSLLTALATVTGTSAAAAAAVPPAPGSDLSAAAASASTVYLAYTGTNRQVYVLNAAAPAQAPIALGGQLLGAPAVAEVPAASCLPAQRSRCSNPEPTAPCGGGTRPQRAGPDGSPLAASSTPNRPSSSAAPTSSERSTSSPLGLPGISYGSTVWAAGRRGPRWVARSCSRERDRAAVSRSWVSRECYLFGRNGNQNGYADFGGLSTASPGTAPPRPAWSSCARADPGAVVQA